MPDEYSFRQISGQHVLDSVNTACSTLIVHELGIATSALDAVLTQARNAGARRVSKIELRVGELSGVDPEALRFALETILPGTVAEGAALAIASLPALVFCAQCGRNFTPEDGFLFACPLCGQPSTTIRQGRELDLVRLELN